MTEIVYDGNQNKSHVPVRLAHSTFDPDTGADPSLNPIIFLHGLISCKETWIGIPQLFANTLKRKTYAYDARNHGDSDWSDDITMDDLVQDLAMFMESVHIPKAILIGHSMGGTVAMQFTLLYPEKVEMLIVEEMFVSKPPSSFYAIPLAYAKLAPKAVRMLPSGTDELTASELIMDFIFKSIPPQSAAVQKQTKIDKSTMALKRTEDGHLTLKANMTVIEKILKLIIAGELEEMNLRGTYYGPACFVCGELSHFQVGNDIDNIRKYFPTATLVEIKNARHSVHSDNTEAYIETILNFISRNEAVQGKL